jgi:hypothetical protein
MSKTETERMHPALTRRVVNADCNPSSAPTQLPDGTAAKLLMLGTPFQPDLVRGLQDWWPHAATPKVQSKLWRRVAREGSVLPALAAVCLALMAEMYTTTVDPATMALTRDARPELFARVSRRTRLRFRSAPIADFGVCVGSVRVTAGDRLAYLDLSTGALTRGQDPDTHYWLYFTTARGEEVLLDCALFTFNMCQVVAAPRYVPVGMPMDFAPAYFRDRAGLRAAPVVLLLHTERRRVSALRHPGLRWAAARTAAGICGEAAERVGDFMRDVAGHPLAPHEVDWACEWAVHHMQRVENVIRSGAWKTFPDIPPLAIEADPGELVDGDEADYAEVRERAIMDKDKILRRAKTLQKRGLVSNETYARIKASYNG